MTRSAIALFALVGVLAMSMPGGACFLWAGLGIEHHHHGEPQPAAQAESCFHDHGCGDQEEAPAEPCEPGEGNSLVAYVGSPKQDVDTEVAVDDFVPAWVGAPLAAKASDQERIGALPSSVRTLVLPPPSELRYCRFLL